MTRRKIDYFVLLAAVLMTAACSGTIDDGLDNGSETPELSLKCDRNYIKADGQDAVTLTLYYNGKEVTEDFTVYNNNTEIELADGNKFVTTELDRYTLWASYKASQSNEVLITSVSIDVPEAPADPKPESTSFVKKVLVVDYTGTGCQFCPKMKTLLRKSLGDPILGTWVSLVEIHSFNSSDPAYFAAPIDEYANVTEYPTVVVDFAKTFSNYNNQTGFEDIVKERHAIPAAGGISVISEVDDNGVVVMKATVKAAEKASFRIGAWILEDGIYGIQSGATDLTMNTHDNCLRLADSRIDGTKNFIGHTLGELNEGDTADHLFIMQLSEDWVYENCHAIVFISVEDERGYFYVNNVLECGLEGSVPFQYKN
ncbi:MAG: Omp28-related outer membrane protein [Candidatus Cryptobacteroides sp.]